MPVISIKMAPIKAEKKKELIEKITQTAVEVTAIPKESFTVVIEEYDLENIGVGGRTLTEILANR